MEESLSRHSREAQAAGLVLIAPSPKGKPYYSYRLPCGHEQDMQATNVREGSFRCQTCLQERLVQEAKDAGLILLGPGRDKAYRRYQLNCGHVREIGTGSVRKGVFACQECIDAKLAAEATARGFEIVGPGTRKDYRLYRLPCGHSQEVNTGSVRNPGFETKCDACNEASYVEEARKAGVQILGPGKDSHYRLYRLPCGHQQQMALSSVRRAETNCRECLNEKLRSEARDVGIELIGPARAKEYRRYRFPCGHEQEIATGSVRINSFSCLTCNDSHWLGSGYVYLIEFRHPLAGAALKFGIAKEIKARVKDYGLKPGVKFSVIDSIRFESYREASDYETWLGRIAQAQGWVLPPEQAKDYVRNGFTEFLLAESIQQLPKAPASRKKL